MPERGWRGAAAVRLSGGDKLGPPYRSGLERDRAVGRAGRHPGRGALACSGLATCDPAWRGRASPVKPRVPSVGLARGTELSRFSP